MTKKVITVVTISTVALMFVILVCSYFALPESTHKEPEYEKIGFWNIEIWISCAIIEFLSIIPFLCTSYSKEKGIRQLILLSVSWFLLSAGELAIFAAESDQGPPPSGFLLVIGFILGVCFIVSFFFIRKKPLEWYPKKVVHFTVIALWGIPLFATMFLNHTFVENSTAYKNTASWTKHPFEYTYRENLLGIVPDSIDWQKQFPDKVFVTIEYEGLPTAPLTGIFLMRDTVIVRSDAPKEVVEDIIAEKIKQKSNVD